MNLSVYSLNAPRNAPIPVIDDRGQQYINRSRIDRKRSELSNYSFDDRQKRLIA